MIATRHPETTASYLSLDGKCYIFYMYINCLGKPSTMFIVHGYYHGLYNHWLWLITTTVGCLWLLPVIQKQTPSYMSLKHVNGTADVICVLYSIGFFTCCVIYSTYILITTPCFWLLPVTQKQALPICLCAGKCRFFVPALSSFFLTSLCLILNLTKS